MSDDLPDVVKAEIDRRVALHQTVLSAIDDPDKLEAIGGRFGRHGTQEHVLTDAPKVDDQYTAITLAVSKHTIAAGVAEKLGLPFPKTIDELIDCLCAEADKTYAVFGLPVGAKNYWLEAEAQQTEWDRWHGGNRPDGANVAVALPLAFANMARLCRDHPVSHAGNLHWCALQLENAIKSEPLDLFHLVSVAMAAQSAADILNAVTAKRRRSGLTDAEAVWRGDDSIATLKNATGKAATKHHIKRDPTLEAAKAILKEPGNRQLSMNGLHGALASKGFTHDAKALTGWIKEAGLMIKREGNLQGYKPNPNLFAK